MTTLSHKAVLHVPMAYYDPETGDTRDIGGFKELLRDLVEALTKTGADSFYTQQAQSFYKGRVYPELLVTIYGETLAGPVETFKTWCRECKYRLRQEAFAVEVDGEMRIYEY